MQAKVTWSAGLMTRRLDTCRMVVFHAPRYMTEEVGRKEERVQYPAAAVESNQGQLVGQSNGEGDVVGEREAEEEDTRE